MKHLKTKDNLHLARKLAHITIGCCALSLPYLLNWNGRFTAIVYSFIGVLGLSLDLLRQRTPGFNTFILKLVQNLAREEEKNKISTLTYYFLGMGLSYYFYTWHIATLSILYLVFCDPSAALMGKLYGKRKILPHKSVAGFMSFFLVALVINSLYIHLLSLSAPLSYSSFIICAALIGALSELFTFIDDNLAIPIISGLGLTLLIQIY